MESPLAWNSQIYQFLLELKGCAIMSCQIFFKAGFHCLDQFGLKFVTLLPYPSKLATTPSLGSKDFKNVFF